MQRRTWNVLMLDGVDTTRRLYIDEVDDAEFAALRKPSGLLVDAIVIVELLTKRRPFVVIDHHGKSLGTVLADKRFDNRKGLTRARCPHNPRTTKAVDNIDPALTELAFVIVAHGDVDGIFVLD